MRRPVLLLSLALASCSDAPRSGPTTVSIVRSSEFATRSATGRGLVRFDALGQVVPDLAARWAIVEDGLDYIFRLEDGAVPKQIARQLRTLRTDRANPLRSWLAPIERIEAVTATVIEIRLSSPMPDLLTVLARPEMALADMPGPMREGGAGVLIARSNEGARLEVADERAGRAIARFAAGKVDMVLGGTFLDLAIARAATVPAGTLVRDPAEGLFGFAAHSTRLDTATLHALGLAIDRDRIAALIGGEGAGKATTIAGSTIEPPLAERIAAARRIIPAPLTIRVAMPDGPGARLLFKLVAQDWQRIGVTAAAVTADASADLALIDIIVPPGEVARVACAISAGCDQRDPLALLDPGFIPLMQPVRWSLVAPTIEGFAENPQAAHPLEHLRRAR